MQKKRILLTGASGFVGRALGTALKLRGDEVIALTRDPVESFRELAFARELVRWDQLGSLRDLDAVVHLAGESVAQRWSGRARQRLLSSRVESARRIREAVAGMPGRRPAVLLSASAIGYFGDRGDEPLHEESPPGVDFLAELCRSWEREAFAFEPIGMRVVALRFGLVLGRGGGALERMLPVFRAGLGGRLGSGRQWMSWIQLDDLVLLLIRALDRDSMKGVYNAVTPNPVRNAEFTRALGAAVGRRTCLPVPAWVLRLLFGEMSGMLLGGQKVEPRRLLVEQFHFRYPEISEAIRASIRR